MLQGKNKLSKTKEEEGDGNCCCLFHGAAPLQLPLFLPTVELRCNATSQQQEEGGATQQAEEGATQLHSTKTKVELRCSIAPQHEEEGNDSCCRLLHCLIAVLQRSVAKKKTRRRRRQQRCRLLRYAVLQRSVAKKTKKKGDGSNATPQQEEEGDGRRQKKQEKKKLDAYLGLALAPAWVSRRLQPLRCSKLLLQAPLLQAPLLRARSRSMSLEL